MALDTTLALDDIHAFKQAGVQNAINEEMAQLNQLRDESIEAPEVGDLVFVRSRRWLVDEVVELGQGQTPLVKLSCADDDAQGQSLDVLWEY